MSYTEVSSDFQDSFFTFRQINLQGSVSELWNRSPQGKSIILRMQSMLPQFKITSEVLSQLYSISTSESFKGSGVCTAYKYSPTHFLSLKVTEVHYITRGQVIPPADYLLSLSPQHYGMQLNRIKSEEKIFDKMMKSIERHINKEELIEPLDICRTLLVFSGDRSSETLQIKCEILYPSISFQFTPIAPLKLVSTPLSVKLTQNKREKFQAGYLTMDQSGRVLPLLPSDPLAYKYPIVGVWVSGIPESQNSKACPIIHPLVWSNCVQFIENSNIRDKISPSLTNNTFLFLHFTNKPKYYEVCTIDNPCWKTYKYITEVSSEDGEFVPCYATFVKEDQSSSSQEMSINLPRTMKYVYTPSGNLQNAPAGSSKPPRQSVSPCGASGRSSEGQRGGYSPNAEKIIMEQSKMLAHLQAQILELQTHIYNNTPKANKHKPIETAISAFTPNRISVSNSQTKVKSNDSCRELFQETPKLQKSSSIQNELVRRNELEVKEMRVKSYKEVPVAKKLNSGANSEDWNLKISFEKKFESVDYEDSSWKSNFDTKNERISEREVKNSSEKGVGSDCGYLGTVSEKKTVYNPLEYENTSPEPSPQPFQSKIKAHKGADNTIYVPKIEFQDVSESSDEDERLEVVERKYLCKN